MKREARIWLGAAGGIAVAVVVVVLIFGITPAPAFPSLYDEGAPTVDASLAYVEYGGEDCVHVLDVASGESHEVYCSQWLALEGWDADGNLRIHSGDGRDYASVVDPDSGQVLGWGAFIPDEVPPPRESAFLRARSRDGHATLVSTAGGVETTLIDVEGPRDYAFWEYGTTADGDYAWVCDSEERILVVPVDGSDGPWIVIEGAGQPMWR